MEENTLVINGVECVRKNEIPGDDIRIVILQRGWVMVGYFSREGNDCTLKKASVIRTWGTTKGLGEIQAKPTSSTKLDKTNGDVLFDWLTVVASVRCDKTWSDYL